jgi:hypothetical protein
MTAAVGSETVVQHAPSLVDKAMNVAVEYAPPGSNSLASPGTREALYRRARAAAERQPVIDTLQDDATRLEEVLDSEEFDVDALANFEEGVKADLDLSAWVEAQTQWLVERVPRLSRERARKIVVVLAYLLSVATLTGISFVPVLGAVPGAIGIDAPTAATKAGVGFDGAFPPPEEEADKSNGD